MVIAFALTALAGAATLVGGLLAVHRRLRCDTGLATALRFAAGAMVLVSLVEILPKGAAALTPSLGTGSALVATLGLAALGAALVVLLGRLAPLDPVAAGDRIVVPEGDVLLRAAAVRRRVLRSGTVTALAVAAHNVPEGLVTLVSTLDDPAAGLAIAVAVAVHNVPEGVAVAAPVYGATGSRRRALGWTALSGLAEPVGALLGYLLLAVLLPSALLGLVFGLVAGVMLQVALAELLPSARRLAPARVGAPAFAAGAATMALSLLLLRLGVGGSGG